MDNVQRDRVQAAKQLEKGFPPSFQENSSREKLLLWQAENFRAQCSLILPEKRPLLLVLPNEAGVNKFVSTSISPSFLPLWGIYDWVPCAKFVAESVTYVPPQSHSTPTESLYSPETVLRTQFGNSLEMSTLLCSLLLGAGYDTYVVFGKVSPWIADMDLTQRLYTSPSLTSASDRPVVKHSQLQRMKTRLKLAKEFKSGYELAMAEREQRHLEDDQSSPDSDSGSDKMLRKRLKRLKTSSSLLKDLSGGSSEKTKQKKPEGAFHSWVLVLPRHRGVKDPFYIEPTTGNLKNIQDPDYHSIISVWNPENYFVNLSCNQQKLNFDFKDPGSWEPFILDVLLRVKEHKKGMGLPHHRLIEPSQTETAIQHTLDAEEAPEGIPCLKIPPSWVGEIKVSHADFERRFHEGKRILRYKNAEVEQFSPYSMKNGLVKREKIFSPGSDHQKESMWTQVESIIENYSNRSDFLEQRVEKYSGQNPTRVKEYFSESRPDGVKEHHYSVKTSSIVQELVFQKSARPEGLLSRETSDAKMIELFQVLGSSDPVMIKDSQSDSTLTICLCEQQLEQKIVNHDKRSNKRGSMRPRIKEIVHIYHDDAERARLCHPVASINFKLAEKRVIVHFRPKPGRITFSSILFKIPALDEKGHVEVFPIEAASVHLAEEDVRQPTHLELLRMLQSLLAEQVKSIQMAQKSWQENQSFIASREAELTSLSLEVTVFHPDRNHDLRAARLKEEKEEAERRARASEDAKDPLLPYLCRRKPADLTWEEFCKEVTKPIHDSAEVCEEFLSDYRDRLVDKANHMQSKIEHTKERLRHLQDEFQAKVGQLSVQKEQELSAEIKEVSFTLRVLEKRLLHLKFRAAQSYSDNEKRILADPRVANTAANCI